MAGKRYTIEIQTEDVDQLTRMLIYVRRYARFNPANISVEERLSYEDAQKLHKKFHNGNPQMREWLENVALFSDSAPPEDTDDTES